MSGERQGIGALREHAERIVRDGDIGATVDAYTWASAYLALARRLAAYEEAAREVRMRRERWTEPGQLPFALATSLDKLAALAPPQMNSFGISSSVGNENISTAGQEAETT